MNALPLEQCLEPARNHILSRMGATPSDHPGTALLVDAGAMALAQSMAEQGLTSCPRQEPPRFQPELPKTSLEDVAGHAQLPALPQVAIELQRAIQDSQSSAGDIARIIQVDPALTTILLHLVNSALYSLPTRIDTIDRAVTVLGTQQVYTMAVGNLVLSMARELPPKGLDHIAFWGHSIACAVAARELSVLTGKGSPERCFVSGLLHDIGRLSLFSSRPDHAQNVVSKSLSSLRPMYDVECEILGFDHARLGAMLLRKWDLPFSIVTAVADHHSQDKAKAGGEAGIVQLADFTVRTVSGDPADASILPVLAPGIWDALELAPEAMSPLLEGLETKIAETISILMH